MRFIIRLVYLLLALGHFALSHAKSPSTTFAEEERSDWVKEPGNISLCKGHYLPYNTEYPVIEDSWLLPIELSANETEFSFEGSSALRGQALLKQGPRRLTADEITVDRSALTNEWDKLIANGHIHYTSPGLNIWGQYAQYLHSEQLFLLDETSYRWYARHAPPAPAIQQLAFTTTTTNACKNTSAWPDGTEPSPLCPQHGAGDCCRCQNKGSDGL